MDENFWTLMNNDDFQVYEVQMSTNSSVVKHLLSICKVLGSSPQRHKQTNLHKEAQSKKYIVIQLAEIKDKKNFESSNRKQARECVGLKSRFF